MWGWIIISLQLQLGQKLDNFSAFVKDPNIEKIDSDYGLEFRNEYGAIRRQFVLSHYIHDDLSLCDVTNLYKEWRDDPEFFILKGKKIFAVPSLDFPDIDLLTSSELEWRDIQTDLFKRDQLRLKEFFKFFKAAKRGNDVYRYTVQQKFNEKLGGILSLSEKWNRSDIKNTWSTKNTNFLFVTLTYGTRKCRSCGKHYDSELTMCPNCNSTFYDDLTVKEAWDQIGVEFNRFKTKIQHEFKDKVEIFRTWEATSHYYPHVHMLIGFHDTSFSVFTNIKKDKKGKPIIDNITGEPKKVYRISQHEKKRIQSCWDSFVDIQAIDITGNKQVDAVDELVKYITKDLCSSKGDKTNSMIWLFGKQSYSVSKGFLGLIDHSLLGVTIDDVATDSTLDMYNSNGLIVEWSFVGVLRGKMIGLGGDVWSYECEKPPPFVKKLIDQEQKRWVALHGGSF